MDHSGLMTTSLHKKSNAAEVLRRRQAAEKELEMKLQQKMKEKAERLKRAAEAKDQELKEKARKMHEKELLKQKLVLDRRAAQLEQDRTKKMEILNRAHTAASRLSVTKSSTSSPQKKVYAFGSSTPRDLAYLEKLSKEQKVYNNRLVAPASSSGRSSIIGSNNCSPNKITVKNGIGNSMTTSMYVSPTQKKSTPLQRSPLNAVPLRKVLPQPNGSPKNDIKPRVQNNSTSKGILGSSMTQSMYTPRSAIGARSNTTLKANNITPQIKNVPKPKVAPMPIKSQPRVSLPPAKKSGTHEKNKIKINGNIKEEEDKKKENVNIIKKEVVKEETIVNEPAVEVTTPDLFEPAKEINLDGCETAEEINLFEEPIKEIKAVITSNIDLENVESISEGNAEIILDEDKVIEEPVIMNVVAVEDECKKKEESVRVETVIENVEISKMDDGHSPEPGFVEENKFDSGVDSETANDNNDHLPRQSFGVSSLTSAISKLSINSEMSTTVTTRRNEEVPLSHSCSSSSSSEDINTSRAPLALDINEKIRNVNEERESRKAKLTALLKRSRNVVSDSVKVNTNNTIINGESNVEVLKTKPTITDLPTISDLGLSNNVAKTLEKFKYKKAFNSENTSAASTPVVERSIAEELSSVGVNLPGQPTTYEFAPPEDPKVGNFQQTART
uniref:MAP7 domain-containing protein 2 n=1 Tax=Parastrongyloides trichosuri TaxID=131310 RepID=A0A0N5A1B3_PARTI